MAVIMLSIIKERPISKGTEVKMSFRMTINGLCNSLPKRKPGETNLEYARRIIRVLTPEQADDPVISGLISKRRDFKLLSGQTLRDQADSEANLVLIGTVQEKIEEPEVNGGPMALIQAYSILVSEAVDESQMKKLPNEN